MKTNTNDWKMVGKKYIITMTPFMRDLIVRLLILMDLIRMYIVVYTFGHLKCRFYNKIILINYS